MKQIRLEKIAKGYLEDDYLSHETVVNIINKCSCPNFDNMEFETCDFINYLCLPGHGRSVNINEVKELINQNKAVISMNKLNCDNKTMVYVIVHPHLCSDHYILINSNGEEFIIFKLDDISSIECFNYDETSNIEIDFDICPPTDCVLSYEFLLTSEDKIVENDLVYKLFESILFANNINIDNN